jgi:hypothetical protein
MRNTIIAIGLAALALTGCNTMTPEQQAEHDQAVQRLENVLARARVAGTFSCPDTTTCDRAWLLTRNYVEANSDTRVREMDAAAIDTFTPPNTGMVGFFARRVPTAGGGMVITLDALCRNMYQSDGTPGPAYADCATKVMLPQTKFRGYLNANL